jgi:uncharacterized membrane protein YdjX (TVP38/TMEM64 family)
MTSTSDSANAVPAGSAATATSRPDAKGVPRGRLAAVAVVMLLVAVAGRSGWVEVADAGLLREAIASMGPLGVLTLLGLFGLAAWLWIPGIVLVTAAVAIYGPAFGAAVSVVGGMVATSHSFLAIRAVAGPPVEPEGRILRWIVDRLEAQPIALVTALRAVFWLSPMVTGSLALSPIRFRDYLLGSFLGFVPSVVLVSAVIERVAALLA